jgi:hypothetical protein
MTAQAAEAFAKGLLDFIEQQRNKPDADQSPARSLN